MNTVNFLHWGNCGDVWASIPAIREYCRKFNSKANVYLEKDHLAEYYEGATHPVKSDGGEMVCLNQKMIDMMIPLLLAQPFIQDAKLYDGEKIHVDLNKIRLTNVRMPNGSINRWYFYCFPNLACDLSKPWLEVPDTDKNFAKGKILINRTERYTNPNINYEFLKPYEDECLFIGTMREYNNFTMNNGLEIRKLNVNNFLEYAQAIKQSKFYISNQSQGYQLCQGQFHPSILEVCSAAPNVIPIGDKMYDFWGQTALEYYFHELNEAGGSEYIEQLKNKTGHEVVPFEEN